MPTVNIPLVGSYNQRYSNTLAASNTGDQRFKGVTFDMVTNPITGESDIYVVKRRGLEVFAQDLTTIGLGNRVFQSPSGNELVVCGSSQGYVLAAYSGTSNNCGTTGSAIRGISDVVISGEVFFLITCLDSTGWYLSENAAQDTTPTFTADTSNGNANLTNVSSTANLYIGQKLTGTGIASGARISGISGSTVTMTLNATATNAGVTVTFEQIAKILDADFPGNAGLTTTGNFAELDGFIFIMTTNGRIYNSDLNSITSWGASSFITANMSTDNGVGVARYKDAILGFGLKSTQVFYNAGNATGSPLSSSDNLFFNIGCASGTLTNHPYVVFKDTVYWVANKQGGSFDVYMMVGFEPKKISTSHISELLVGGNSGQDYAIFAYDEAGYTTVFIADSVNNSFFASYNVGLNIWSEPNFGNSQSQQLIYGAYGGQGGIFFTGGSGTSIVIYNQGQAIYTEFGAAVVSVIQTKKINFGSSNRKSIKSISLISDKQSAGTMTLEVSDDDFATWQTLGTFDLTSMKPRIHRCGSFVGARSFRLTHSSSNAFRVQSLEIDYEIGQH